MPRTGFFCELSCPTCCHHQSLKAWGFILSSIPHTLQAVPGAASGCVSVLCPTAGGTHTSCEQKRDLHGEDYAGMPAGEAQRTPGTCLLGGSFTFVPPSVYLQGAGHHRAGAGAATYRASALRLHSAARTWRPPARVFRSLPLSWARPAPLIGRVSRGPTSRSDCRDSRGPPWVPGTCGRSAAGAATVQSGLFPPPRGDTSALSLTVPVALRWPVFSFEKEM